MIFFCASSYLLFAFFLGVDFWVRPSVAYSLILISFLFWRIHRVESFGGALAEEAAAAARRSILLLFKKG
jgi:hypothetical protein